MTPALLEPQSPAHPSHNIREVFHRAVPRVALLGNPNTGKSTLFNRLTGLRAKTANYPGTTVEVRSGKLHLRGGTVEVLDLPGIYSLDPHTDEEKLALSVLDPNQNRSERRLVAVVVLDATNLRRHLFLATQLVEKGLPVVLVVNMIDKALQQRIHIRTAELESRLQCPVISMSATSGFGLPALLEALDRLSHPDAHQVTPPVSCPSTCTGCSVCPFQQRFAWADELCAACVAPSPTDHSSYVDRVDRYLLQPVIGILCFSAVMFMTFFVLFRVAAVPMDIIDGFFAGASSWLSETLPGGLLTRLLAEGVVPGVGGVLVFLPQIGLLFFLLTLLEDSGYLARAAFVLDRVLRRVGLPGAAFVPLLSAHACAIPAMLATRVMSSRKDRLLTILVIPLMSCSARIPVYAMLAALLFPNQPLHAALLFTGAYLVSSLAALGAAFVFKHTLFRGESASFLMELPDYRRPRLRNALRCGWERMVGFVRQAGGTILVICVILWALSSYPRIEPSASVAHLFAQSETVGLQGDADRAESLRVEAESRFAQESLEGSVLGRLGRWLEPVFAPVGYDWQIGIGVLTSLAAREVVVSTLAIIFHPDHEAAATETDSLYDALRSATRADGRAVFSTATCVSLLIFFMLAMQCLPTLATTRKETGSWGWPVFQFTYMTLLAYGAAWAGYRIMLLLGA